MSDQDRIADLQSLVRTFNSLLGVMDAYIQMVRNRFPDDDKIIAASEVADSVLSIQRKISESADCMK